MQSKILHRARFAYPSSRPQAIGSLEKELSAKPTEDGLPQFPTREMVRLSECSYSTELSRLSHDTGFYISVVFLL
jgi:hypothetical protein